MDTGADAHDERDDEFEIGNRDFDQGVATIPDAGAPGENEQLVRVIEHGGLSRAERMRRARMARRRLRVRWAMALAAVAMMMTTASVAKTAMAATSSSGRTSSSSAAGASLTPPGVPAHSAYLGAFVTPHLAELQAQADVRNELSQMGNFDGAIGRPLGLVHVYQSWGNPVKTSTLAALASTGATPVIDWTCTSDASIINGSQDGFIAAYANTVKAYGHPVFLRWFWEMNLVALPRASACLGSLGAAGFVQAWQHIWTIFQAHGATNVAFIWCPSIYSLGTAYYPGDAYVDWIGWDGYDRKQDPNMLTNQFLPFYNNWATHGKPMMIGETGATIDQETYLAQLTSVLPVSFPQVHAVLYYDSKSTSDWTLVDVPGQLGFTQFVAMAQTPYFGFPFVGS